MNHTAAAPATVRLRAAALWALLVIATACLGAGVIAGSLPILGRPPRDASFDEFVLRVATVVALLASCSLSLLATTVLRDVWNGPEAIAARAASAGGVRRALLAACGASLAATLTATSSAADTSPPPGTLTGLPLPDRAEGGPARPHAAGPAVATEHDFRVRAGDSLWSIAQHRTGPRATAAEVAAYWQELQALNREALAPDPDLIHPGLSLDLPHPTPRRDS